MNPRDSALGCAAGASSVRQSDSVTVETRTVWVEELDCCGDPFELGSSVTWELHSVDDGERRFLRAVFGEDIAARITDGYERHGQYEGHVQGRGV